MSPLTTESATGNRLGRPLGGIALGAAAVSTVGYLTLLVGHLVDPSGFTNGAHPSVANDVAFFAFVLGLLAALLLGGAGWLAARRSGSPADRRTSGRALLWSAGLLVLAVVGAALGG